MSFILIEDVSEDCKMGVWQIDQNESEILEKFEITKDERAILSDLKGRRRIEWLSGRFALHLMSGVEKRILCETDEFGKPHLLLDDHQVSLSHSNGFVAVIIGSVPIGIDIQFQVNKIERIAHKFMRACESASLELNSKIQHLHIYWGAKESMYKAYGRRRLDFRKHILVEPFPYDREGAGEASIQKGEERYNFSIYWKTLNEYSLVWAIQKNKDV